jgi:hypothetical protein
MQFTKFWYISRAAFEEHEDRSTYDTSSRLPCGRMILGCMLKISLGLTKAGQLSVDPAVTPKTNIEWIERGQGNSPGDTSAGLSDYLIDNFKLTTHELAKLATSNRASLDLIRLSERRTAPNGALMPAAASSLSKSMCGRTRCSVRLSGLTSPILRRDVVLRPLGCPSHTRFASCFFRKGETNVFPMDTIILAGNLLPYCILPP